MTKYPTGCSRCGGSLIRDNGAIKCLMCGREATDNLTLGRFYQLEKPNILKDIKEIGPKATRLKWQIPSGTFFRMRERWEPLDEQLPPAMRLARNKGKAVPLPAPEQIPIEQGEPESNGILPRLPVWQDTWPEAIQVRWLDIWIYLATKDERKEVPVE